MVRVEDTSKVRLAGVTAGLKKHRSGVESLTATQAHPLLGWSQGHFIIAKDISGAKRIFTPNHKAVYAIEAELDAPRHQLSTGQALGVKIGDKNRFDPLGSEFFKNVIRENLSD